MDRRSHLFITAVVAGLAAQPAHAAPEARTFDRLAYSAPEGWNVEDPGRGFVSISRIVDSTYCMIAIYSSVPASGDLAATFAAEWQNVAIKTVNPMPAPASSVASVGNTRAAMAGAPVTIKGAPGMALMFVLDEGASVQTIFIVSSSMEAFATFDADVKQLLGSLVVQRADVPAPQPAPGGKLVFPPLSQALTLTDLAGDWQKEDRISTAYVDRQTGAYAGSDNLAFRDTWTITAKGALTSHFFAVRNGKKLVNETTGTIKVLGGRILDVKMGANQQWVLRGWLELPSMTVMKIVGPFYDGVIPQNILDNPEQGVNLEKHWIRKKPAPK